MNILRKLIPRAVFKKLQPIYHYSLTLAGAIRYGFPSRKLFVIGVTGTKGKSSVSEILNAILEEAGFNTALSGTIRFKIGKDSKPNMYKMSMPGRFFMQNFLWRAKKAGCTHAVIEMTSEGAKQFRHKFIALDALIFTNLSPEHIESHGSYEKYREAKLSIARLVEKSNKPTRYIVANTDDGESVRFLAIGADKKIGYSLHDADPYNVSGGENSQDGIRGGIELTFKGEKIHTKLEGLFNVYNILAAATLADAMGIKTETIRAAIEKISGISGRVEHIYAGGKENVAREARQNFDVIVDYAHTADSLEKLYQAFPERRKICILGNTGGGRDKWKRPVMAKIAEKYCDQIILTNEDPYDEDPRAIVEEMRAAISNKPCEIILDRREAIAHAISLAGPGDVILISGKGTDPYIMGANGTKIPWSDARVAREELEKVFKK